MLFFSAIASANALLPNYMPQAGEQELNNCLQQKCIGIIGICKKKPPEVALFRGWQNNGKLGAAGSLLTFILHPNSVQPKWLLQLYQKGGHELWHLSKTFLCQFLSHLLQQICIRDL